MAETWKLITLELDLIPMAQSQEWSLSVLGEQMTLSQLGSGTIFLAFSPKSQGKQVILKSFDVVLRNRHFFFLIAWDWILFFYFPSEKKKKSRMTLLFLRERGREEVMMQVVSPRGKENGNKFHISVLYAAIIIHIILRLFRPSQPFCCLL